MARPITLALVTDTHVRPTWDDGQQAFPSDAEHNHRNQIAANAIRKMAPDLIIHLGDVVHPIPTLPTHREALTQAKAIYGDLGAPLLVVPGNHDVGDKRSSASAPVHVNAGREAFRSTWGPPFQSLEIGGCHVVIVDGGILGLDTEEARAQRAWLEQDLASAQGRIFLFTHYPPYLCEPDEHEHYDNLAPAPRTFLLDLAVSHRVEAIFSGHVHRFFLNRHHDIDLYTLPGAAFVRPEYAALRAAPPTDAENGRDDREHLGVTCLTIDDDGHRISVYRPLSRAPGPPAPPRRLGTWLRHRLGRRSELPIGDLDALTRKTARDDMTLLQILDLGLSRIRLPLVDLDDHDTRVRLSWLHAYGVRPTFFTSGLPTPAQRACWLAHAREAEWEVICRPSEHAALRDLLSTWDGPPLTLGRIGRPLEQSNDAYFSHFPREGFHPEDPALDLLVGSAAPGSVTGIAFRIAADAAVAPQVEAAVRRADGLHLRATCHVELPFLTEATRQTDDALVEQRSLDAATAAERYPTAHVMLDLLVDKDRGYWCRNGLVDVADRPRAAYVALKRDIERGTSPDAPASTSV